MALLRHWLVEIRRRESDWQPADERFLEVAAQGDGNGRPAPGTACAREHGPCDRPPLCRERKAQAMTARVSPYGR